MFWQVEDVPSVPDFQSFPGVPCIPCFSNDPNRYAYSINLQNFATAWLFCVSYSKVPE